MAGLFHPRVKSRGQHVSFSPTDLSITGEHTGKNEYVGWMNEKNGPSSRASSSASSWMSSGVLGRPPSVNSELDPDHEPIGNVLSRLGDYTQNFMPDMPIACTDCECKSAGRRILRQQTMVYSSDEEEESDSDEEGMKMSMLLKMLQQLEEKGISKARQKAMMTLVNAYTGEEVLSMDQLNQMMKLLHKNQPTTQEACLSLLTQSARMLENTSCLLELKVLDHLYLSLSAPRSASVCRPTLLLLEVLFSHEDCKECWLERSMNQFLPLLLSILKGQMTLDVKYAVCCVFRSLANLEEFILQVTEDILPAVLKLKDASAKFKEVYVEILTGLISLTDFIPSDLVDSSAIPITTSIIRDGPCVSQCAAIHLLASLTNTDPGVTMVIGTNNLVSMVMCCMKESHCRRVRLNATEVMKNLTGSRKLGLCKDLMMNLSSYLVPSPEQETLQTLSNITGNQRPQSPTKHVFDEERRMWNGLEKFMEATKTIIYKESQAETDELGTVIHVHLKPCIDVYPDQLALISQALGVLQNLCLWPLDKSRLGFSANKVDLTTFTDDEKQRLRLSKVNRGLTQAIWDKVGVIVIEVLFSYSEKFEQLFQESSKGRQSLSLECVFEAVEVTLIQSLLDLLLCAAVCTCVAFPEILPKLEPASKPRSKSPAKLKSSSVSQIHHGQTGTRPDSRLASKSDVGQGMNAEKKMWVKDNPHLTHLGRYSSGPESPAEKQKADLHHKEACTDRRLLRKCLYESGVFCCICPFLKCSDKNVQIVVFQILRCMVHPLEERVMPRPPSYKNCGSSSRRQRPQTAMSSRETEKKLGQALHQMSPNLAGMIKEALGQRPATTGLTKGPNKKGPDKVVQIPGHPDSLEVIHERLQEYAEAISDQIDPAKGQDQMKIKKPTIDVSRPIARQCREMLLQEAGTEMVTGIFNKAQELKKQGVLLMHDMVQFGELETYMHLSKIGCIPKLLDFLRVNDDNELLEITGLIIVRILVNSDSRLKQLFNRHGGPALLMAMAQYTSGLLKQEVANTLKSVTKDLPSGKKRPCSAPAGTVRTTSTNKPADIWDFIQQRWMREDQVTDVLRQWTESKK